MRFWGIDSDKTIALHKAFDMRQRQRYASATGHKISMKPLADETYYKRATFTPSERALDVPIAEELDPMHVGTSLYQTREAAIRDFGLDKSELETRARSVDCDQMRAKRLDAYETERARLLRIGLHPRQLTAAMEAAEDKYLTRAWDPGTDTSLVGIDYQHTAFEVFRLAGLVEPLLNSTTIGKGFRSYTLPYVDASQFLLQSPLATDAYTVNTAVDPTNGSVNFVPVFLQANTFWNGAFDEDALFAVEPVLRAAMARGAAICKDHMLISGDTTNTTAANINASGGALVLGTLDPRVGFNGFRGIYYRGTHGGKSAATFTGGISGSGNAGTFAVWNSVKKSLGKYSVPDQQDRLFAIMANQTYLNTVADTAGNSYYGQDIVNKQFYGTKIAVCGNSAITHAASSEIPTLAGWLSEGVPTNLNTAGVYDNTTKTQSTYVMVNPYNFLVAWKRQLSMTVMALPPGDQYVICATMRFVMKEIVPNETAIGLAYNVL